MSANLNVTRPDSAMRVLMLAANPAVSSVTGWPVGFWWAELTHPFHVFAEAGYEIEVRSPDGGTLVPDGYSDPDDESGYSAHDFVSRGFKHSPLHRRYIEDTPALTGDEASEFDAIFVVGGQSPMFTFRGNEAVQRAVVGFFEAGRVTALVCHATCVLLDARGPDGSLLVEGRTWTGFANSEEQFADDFVGQRLQPFWIEDQARAIEGSNFIVDQRFRPFAVRDGLLVTGQQQYSGAAAARLVVEALGA